MKPPKYVQVGQIRYEVLSDEAVMDRAAVSTDSTEEQDGETDFNNQKIYYRAKRGPDFIRETVLHETLHTITDQTGIRSEMGNDEEEKLVRRLTPLLLDVLRRNPSLIRYLTE